VIDYRHLIEHCCASPGPLRIMCIGEELFPASSFRLAYDRLVATTGSGPVGWSICICSGWRAELGEAAISSLVSECRGPAHPGKWR